MPISCGQEQGEISISKVFQNFHLASDANFQNIITPRFCPVTDDDSVCSEIRRAPRIQRCHSLGLKIFGIKMRSWDSCEQFGQRENVDYQGCHSLVNKKFAIFSVFGNFCNFLCFAQFLAILRNFRHFSTYSRQKTGFAYVKTGLTIAQQSSKKKL